MENLLSNKEPQIIIKHSAFGIASFIISIIAWISLLMTLIVAVIIAAVVEPINIQESYPIGILVGSLLLIVFLLSLIGIGLGIAGLFQKKRKKVFSILGLIFNGIVFLGIFVLFIIGNIINNRLAPPI